MGKGPSFGRGRRLAIALNVLAVVALSVGAWAAFNVVATRPAFRAVLDVSPQQRFTLSEPTRDLLARLRREGDLRFEIHTFLEEVHPRLDPTRINQRVVDLTRDLLTQYDYHGGDQVRVVHHDVYRDQHRARETLRELETRQLNSVVVRLGSRRRVLEVLRDLADVELPGGFGQGAPGAGRVPVLRGYRGEEAVTSALQSLLEEGVVAAYFLQGHDGPGLRDETPFGLGPLVRALGDLGIEARPLDLRDARAGGRVPEDAAVVAIVEPESELGPDELDAVDAYLDRGGRLVISSSYFPPVRRRNPSFGRLAERLGFAFSDLLLCAAVADPHRPGEVRAGTSDVQNIRVIDVNPRHPATAGLAARSRWPFLKMCRALLRREHAEGVTTEFLLSTGPRAFEVDATLPLPEHRLFQPAEGFSTYDVGISVVSADPESPFRAVVLTGYPLAAGGFDQNQDLALGVFQWLTERMHLVTVPTKTYVARRLDLVQAQKERIRRLLLYYLPGLLMLMGIAVFLVRRR